MNMDLSLANNDPDQGSPIRMVEFSGVVFPPYYPRSALLSPSTVSLEG